MARPGPRGTGPLPPAALEFESPSAAIIATAVPPLSRVTNLLVFLLVVSVLAACGLIQIDKIVSGTGKLTADAPNILLRPFDQAIVESIDARKGDIVRKGQVLARLNSTFSSADLTTLQDQVDLLNAEVMRLQSEFANSTYKPDPSNPHAKLQASIFGQRASEYKSSLQNYDQTINQLKAQIAGDSTQAKYYRERLSLASKNEQMRQKLQDLEIGSTLNTQIATDARLNMASALAQAETDGAQAGSKLAAQKAERETFVQRWKGQTSQELADTRRRLVQAQQELAKTSLRNNLVTMTAPRDSVVLSVAQVTAGSVVSSAEPLIHLVPIDAPLSVEVDISGIDSGYVRPGDEVTIKFDTLPYLQYGTGRGVVRSISADSFNPESAAQDGGSALPNRPSSLYYKGDIALAELLLHDTPPGFRLMPGMPVAADVKVGTRSVLSYFIARILPVVYGSMHEP